MFTHKDIDMRTIFVVNCIEHNRSLRVNNGELMLEELGEDKKKNTHKVSLPKAISSFYYRSYYCYNPTHREM